MMTLQYELIIHLAFFGALLQEIPLYQKFIERIHLDRKPFNCALCLSFWMGIPLFGFTINDFFIFNIIGHAVISAVLAELINRKLQ